MKKILIFGSILALSEIVNAQTQWSNGTGNNILKTTTPGKVGIGTAPSVLLDLSTGTNLDGIRIKQTQAFASMLKFEHDANLGGHEYAIYSSGNNNPNPGSLEIYDHTSAATRLFIKSDGNIGIGTQSPTQKLDVRQGAIQVVNAPMVNNSGGYTFLGRSANPGSNDVYLYHRITTNYHLIGSGFNGPSGARKIGFAIGGADDENEVKMTIHPSGQVQIGTSSPAAPHNDYKLSVQGKIVAQSVYVTPNTNVYWPDYVFEKEYELLKLPELEKYFLKNKHLPEVPSTKEVIENGIDLGDMNSILLKKVEELTLYIVDINKKVEVLQKQNNDLMNNHKK